MLSVTICFSLTVAVKKVVNDCNQGKKKPSLAYNSRSVREDCQRWLKDAPRRLQNEEERKQKKKDKGQDSDADSAAADNPDPDKSSADDSSSDESSSDTETSDSDP